MTGTAAVCLSLIYLLSAVALHKTFGNLLGAIKAQGGRVEILEKRISDLSARVRGVATRAEEARAFAESGLAAWKRSLDREEDSGSWRQRALEREADLLEKLADLTRQVKSVCNVIGLDTDENGEPW